MNTENVLVEYQPHVAAITALQTKYKDVVYDVTTPTGYTGALGESKEFKKLFNQIDKVRAEIKKPALERCRQIDDQAKQFTAPLKARFTELESILLIEDEKTAIRIAAIESKIESIKTLPMRILGKTAEHIRECLQELMGTNPNDFEEYNHAAKGAIDASIPQIEAILEDRERLEIAEAKQTQLAEENRHANEAIAAKQREQQAIIDAQQKEIDDARKEIQAENNRIAQEKQDRENNERIARERDEAAKAALIKAEQDRVDREIREADEKAKAKALMPEVDVVVAWLESIVESAPNVHDEKLARLVTSVKAASNNHIRAYKEAKAA